MVLINSNVILLFALLPVFTSVEAITKYEGIKRIELVDSLLKSLEHEKWDHEEAGCLLATTSLLNGVRNQTLWATWIWNSMQMPAGIFYGSRYHLGNFDQCLKTPWSASHPDLRMQYCLVDVKLAESRKYSEGRANPYGNAEGYIGTESLYGSRMNTLHLGVCLPNVCKPESISKISQHIFKLSYLPFESVHVDPRDCQVVQRSSKFSTEFYIICFVLLAMVLINVVIYYLGSTREMPDCDSTASKILRCFCLNRNYHALITISNNEVKVIHGLRVITSGTLIVIHSMFMINVQYINHLDLEKEFTSTYGAPLIHLDTCVDTFFLMSGLLHIRGLLSSRSFKPFNVLLKRYLRLLTPFVFAFQFIGHVLPHMASGPAWPRLVREHYEPCTKSWWKNLLMMGNRVDEEGYCMAVSWYIHCDYQLTVLGTFLFMFYHRSRISGFIMFSAAYILSVIIPASLNYWHGITSVLFYDFGESQDVLHNKVYNTTYSYSHSRGSAYIIGMAIGYLIYIYRPQEYRKTISKFWSIVGFIIGLSLMMYTLQIGANLLKKEYGPIQSAIYSVLDRNIWAVGVSFIIVACEYGTLPIINDFLSSRVFIPLSKLSYANYMFHVIFVYRNLFALRAAPAYDLPHLIINGLGYAVITYLFSYLFWHFVEAPVSNLVNLIFEDRNPKSTQNGNAKMSGYQNGVKTEKIT